MTTQNYSEAHTQDLHQNMQTVMAEADLLIGPEQIEASLKNLAEKKENEFSKNIWVYVTFYSVYSPVKAVSIISVKNH